MTLQKIENELSLAQALAKINSKKVIKPLIKAQELVRNTQLAIAKEKNIFATNKSYVMLVKNIMLLESRIIQARQCIENMEGELFEPKAEITQKDYAMIESFITKGKENLKVAIICQKQLYDSPMKKAA